MTQELEKLKELIGQKETDVDYVTVPSVHRLAATLPTFKELGGNWVDGAYRGVAVPKSTPENVRKQVSDMMDALNKDPELRRKMVDGGFEVVDIGYDRIPAFMKERTQDYMGTAKLMGLIK